jgi:primosomal protein N' (replication factor Y)
VIARVLLPLPIDKAFDFNVPKTLEPNVQVGRRVRVPFHGKTQLGVVFQLLEKSDHKGPLESIVAVLSSPAFSQDALNFCIRIADDTLAPRGITVNRTLPSRITCQEERALTLTSTLEGTMEVLEGLARRAPRQAALLRQVLAAPGPCLESDLRSTLGGSVRRVVDRLLEKRILKEVSTQLAPLRTRSDIRRPALVETLLERLPSGGRVLLFGDQRWDLYLHLAQSTMAAVRGLLILAPEIFLAHQLHTYLEKNVGGEIALYHSNLPEGERGRIWEAVRKGELRFVVGTRSALFLPYPDLGLIVVDEEQDRAYKQDEMLPYYHARSASFVRKKKMPVLLGSAAPSLETFHDAEKGSTTLVRLEAPLKKGPHIRVVDMKDERGVLSATLKEASARTFAAGERVLLGVNRRGYFQAVLCKGCNQPIRCRQCGINLTYDVKRTQLFCRGCGERHSRMVCPHCGSRSLRFVGSGSRRVEVEIREHWPRAKVVHLDAEALRTSDGRAFEETARADVLVATPIVAKGPPLPGVTLVAAVGIDALLALPDFRAAERTYQYLVGLSNRSNGGEAVIQTHYPDHFAIRAAVDRDYDRFYSQEMIERRRLFYPPYSVLARLVVKPSKGQKLGQLSIQVEIAARENNVLMLGPVPHPTRRGWWEMLMKGETADRVREACLAVYKTVPHVEIDIEPA